MKKLNFIFCGLLALVAVGCSSDEPSAGGNNTNDNPYERIILSRGEAEVAYSSYDFTWNLFAKTNESHVGKNICLSPTSAQIALTMLLNGAEGETRDEIIRTLGLDGMSVAQINESTRFLVDDLTSRDKNCKLLVANSLWIDENMPIRDEYKSILAENFNATASNTTPQNFAKDVNAWCKEHTEGLIDDIIDEGQSYDYTIINALYFQNIWSSCVKFKSAGERDFTNCDNTVTKMPFMKGEEISCSYGETDKARHAHLNFGNGAYRMSITLPKEDASLTECIAELKDRATFERVGNADLTLTMPKFEIKNKLELKSLLQSLGIQRAFDAKLAELSGISPLKTFIKDVNQGYSFKVDEKGATAAAVTVIGGELTATLTLAPEPMVVDRPFIFTIYEASTRCILFAGKIERF
ncbi:MAG: serpin family protein [Clostridium sp.]|nr:serpin family protein [Clostridium sp.]